MHAYIRSRATFRPLLQRPALDYDLVLDALDSTPSTVILPGADLSRSLAGGFLQLAGSLFLISQVTPKEHETALTLAAMEDIFSRPRPYSAPAAGAKIGDFIKSELESGWRDETDAVYAMPYITVTTSDTTAFVAPETDAQGYYILSNYLRDVRREYGVTLGFSDSGAALQISVRKLGASQHVLAAGDGHTQLLSSSYSRTAVAKCTTVQPVDTGQVDAGGKKIFSYVSTDWYLAQNGAVSTTVPSARADGEWRVISVSEKNSAQEAAEALFAKNSETCKVELAMDVRPRPRDELRLRLPSGQLYTGVVTAVSRRKGDGRWLCRSGSLATTLTDKVRAAGSGSAGGKGGLDTQALQPGDVFWTTRSGDPAKLLGYGAWNQLTLPSGMPSGLKAWLRSL